MNFSQILFATVFLFSLSSCLNGVDKKQKTAPQKNENPSTEIQKREKSIPKFDSQKPVDKPMHEEIEKKKEKAIDTLKPIVTVP